MGGMALMGDEQDRARAYEAWGSFGVSRPGHGFMLHTTTVAASNRIPAWRQKRRHQSRFVPD